MCEIPHPDTTSDYDRGYSRGYAAILKRVSKLKAEIKRLKEVERPNPDYNETIEWLLKTSEAFLKVVELMLEKTPNDQLKGLADVAGSESEVTT